MPAAERPKRNALGDLVAALKSTPAHTSESLAAALSAPISLDDVAEWMRFDEQNYRRNLVARFPTFELRLLCFLPGQRTSLHGHDGSACAFRILRGTSTEIRLRQPDRQWTPGTVVCEGGVELVHQVTNLGDEPLVSLHAYAPPLPMDQPPARYEGRQIVIIGGGVSGASLAIHLLAGAPRELKIAFVERRPWFGRGPAYGTTDPAMRLNVPADRMSLFPDAPGDFVAWARGQGARVPDAALLPRPLFGEYVEDRLATAIAGSKGKVWFHRSEAVAASAEGVRLADGAWVEADAVVLATGNQLPAAPSAFAPELLRSNRVVGDPWTAGALAAIDPGEDVLLVGTGLTAVDVLLVLRNQSHRGRVVAVSRRGLLPRPHLAAGDPRRRALTVDPDELPRPHDVLALSRWLRAKARRLEAEGVGWQCLIDALRPHTAELWGALPHEERRRFMRRLRPFWEVARHRAAPDALATIDAWRARGTLEIMTGRVLASADGPEGIEVTLAPRDGATLRRRFDRVVLATGPDTDARRWPAPLFRQLLRDRLLQADPLGLGLVTDDLGRAVGPDGPTPWLYAMGNLRRPLLWETTAVPEIVRQAVDLALALRA